MKSVSAQLRTHWWPSKKTRPADRNGPCSPIVLCNARCMPCWWFVASHLARSQMDAKGRPTMIPHRESSPPTPIWQILAGSLLGGGMVTQGKYPIDPILGFSTMSFMITSTFVIFFVKLLASSHPHPDTL